MTEEAGTTTANFGESDFGERLSYKKEGGCCADWRDRGWAIFYYIHVTIMVVLSIALPLKSMSSNVDNGNSFTPSPTRPNIQVNIPATGFAVTILVQCVVGAVFGLIWLKVMQMFAEVIIKGMLFLVLILWIVVAVIGFIIMPQSRGMGLAMIIIGILFFIINGIYTWCIWSRIPFSSALLSIASSITQTFEGTICISLLMIPINMAWYFIWSFSFYGFILDVVLSDNPPSNGILYLLYFLLCLSLYWGIQVNKNISHTTTCGVTATWYFSNEVHKPTGAALNRTLTTSFGSVCFGSFIVAVLQATRELLESLKGNSILGCIVYCILLCIEALIRYFNMYAYAQCAIYGSDFITAAKATWGLFMSKGFEAIINDDLTGLALFCGGFLSFVVCFFVGWFMIPLFYPKDIWYPLFVTICQIIFGLIGGILGYMLCVQILYVVRSSIVCLFVCFAEDPNALQQNRPDQYNQLINSRDELNTYAQTGHTGIEQEKKQ